jgi:hypothetical protein
MEITAQHSDNHSKLSVCFDQLNGLGTMPRSKMCKIYDNIRQIWSAMDSEFVECRRRQRLTLKYTELQTKYLDSIKVFEQWTIMATLIYS